MLSLALALLPQNSVAPKPEHVGGAVSAPEVIVETAPEYPQLFFKKNSVVVIDLVVDTEGLPQNVHIVKSGGEKFDKKAIEAVEKYRFKPSLKEGQPVPVEIRAEVHFSVKRPN